MNGMGMPGLDYFLCVAGQFIAIEAKVPGKEPTPRQENTMAAIRLAGGKVFVVWDEKTMQEFLRCAAKVIKMQSTAATLTDQEAPSHDGNIIALKQGKP